MPESKLYNSLKKQQSEKNPGTLDEVLQTYSEIWMERERLMPNPKERKVPPDKE